MKKTLLLFAAMLAACAAQAQEGVEIGGVIWATCNVGESGTFVAAPEDYGHYYTYEQARTACPEGWRLPSQDELQNLAEADNSRTTVNGVNGHRFGTGDHSIFLPAAGYRHRTAGTMHEQGSYGYYRSSGLNGVSSAFHLFTYGDSVHPTQVDMGSKERPFSVRCVRGAILPEQAEVVIDGVTWATRNVGEPGTFVAAPEDHGNLYTLAEALTACPQGWRLPTKAELESLTDAGTMWSTIWTTVNGVYGRRYGSGSNTLFLPAAGFRDDGTPRSPFQHREQGSDGYYRSSDSAFFLHFSEVTEAALYSWGKNAAFSLRCVKK